MVTTSRPKVSMDTEVGAGQALSDQIVNKLTQSRPASSSMRTIPFLLATGQLGSLLGYLFQLTGTTLIAEDTLSISTAFALAEWFRYLPTIIDLGIAASGQVLCKTKRSDPAPLEGDDVPGVDLLITACKESVDVVLDTVVAACNLDYPRSKFRVIVADDGDDKQLRSSIDDLRSEYDNLIYYTRPKPVGRPQCGFKSGNINATLKFLACQNSKGEGNPWIGLLDADMIPDPSMLRALMGYTRDSRVGLVTLPQDFYNIPVNDPLHQNLILQHEAEQVLRDKFDAAWCVGSGFVLKREAYDKIGGFSEDSMSEDLLLGWTLNGRGYKTLLCNERLQSGLQPSSFVDHIKQRRRWFIGGMRNAKDLSFGFGHPKLAGMSAWQKVAALNQIPKPFTFALSKTVSWFAVVVCLAYGRPVVSTHDMRRVVSVMFWYATYMLTSRVGEYRAHRAFDIRNIRRRQIVSIWQGLHLAKSTWQENMPSFIGGQKIGWAVTGAKQTNIIEANERKPNLRPGPIHRLYRLHQAEKVLYHLVFFVLVATLFLAQLKRQHAEIGGKALWQSLAVSILFPGLQVETVLTFLSPILYAMFPPTEKPRKEYMYRDKKTGFQRPKPEARGAKFTKSMYLWEVVFLAATAWSVIAWWLISQVA